jgi:hypothetical protein
MDIRDDKKVLLEKEYEALVEKARLLYPDIDLTLTTLNNMTAQTTDLQEYLNLTMQTPPEISSNRISNH